MSAHDCTVPGCPAKSLAASVHGRRAIAEGWGHHHRYAPERKRRKPLNRHSPPQQSYYDEVRIPAVLEAQGRPCEAALPGICIAHRTDVRDIHEIVSRSAAGSLPLAVELGTAVLCRACHNFVTQNPIAARHLGLRMTRSDLGLDSRDAG